MQFKDIIVIEKKFYNLIYIACIYVYLYIEYIRYEKIDMYLDFISSV